MPIANKLRKNLNYIICLIVYALLSAFIATHFNKFITGNDAFLYLSIANKYANGHFYEAVNDYWSPLLSWLLTPLLYFKVDPIVSVRIIQFLIGAFTLIGFIKIISTFNLSVWLKYLSSLIAILLVTYFSIEETPDVLFTGFILWYVYFITKEDFIVTTGNIILIGIVGALLYFTKAIGFYIFLIHITLYITYWVFKKKELRSAFIKNYIIVIIIFTAVSIIWVTALTFKYHHLTISDAGKYNFAIVGPKNISLEEINAPFKHPINNGIYQLPDKFSLNYWERPQVSTVAMQWSPFSSTTNFNFFLHLIAQNFLRLYYDILFRLCFVLWLISAVLYSYIKKANPFADFKELSMLGLIALTVLPYTCIFIVPRYLLPSEILFFIATVYNFNAIENSSKNVRGVIILILFITTISVGRYWLINFNEYDNSRGNFQLAHNDINKLHDSNINGSIASLQSGYNAMLKTSLLGYYTQNQYLGQISEDSLGRRNYSSLNNKLKYLFVWNYNNFNGRLFTNFNTVFLDTTSHLKIFDIAEHK